MHIQTLAWVFVAFFMILGVFGFVPSLLYGGFLFGILSASIAHNLFHILSGLLAGYVALSSKDTRLYFKIAGVVYVCVAILGYIQGGSVLGLIQTGMADHIFHAVIGLLFLYIGFLMKEKEDMQMSNMGGGIGSGMSL